MTTQGKKLVIVESPAKAKTINKILGKDYKVAASIGHVIDLPKTKFGVDIEKNFEPSYVTIKGKNKVIKELREQAKKAENILLATDPDREGEAIAYHIAKLLEKSAKDITRIEFNEITREAVLRAIEHPRAIDEARVDAQQARRVMDRIVGYQVSPFLWETIYRGLSAGRVQSVALRLIAEREKDIKNFESVEYWTIDALLEAKESRQFKARLYKIEDNLLDPNKFRIKNESEAEEHRRNLLKEKYVISNIDKKTVTKKPPAPFITSTLQQVASRYYRMTTSRVMSIAQQLYEGVDLGQKGNTSLITYMRTDSTRISQEAIGKTRNYITSSYGPTYLPPKPNYYGKKKGAQDAHEAIRPTYISEEYEPKKLKKYLSADQYKIYEIIWKRFIACQMKPGKAEKTVITITAGKYEFRAEGEIITFPGYLVAYSDEFMEANGDENSNKSNGQIPDGLAEGQQLKLNELIVEQRFTQPPPRYTESSLVKLLDKLGIGRPSTYAQIITTLFMRKYIERDNRALVPTDLGITVVDLLISYFPDIFNVKFTAEMEANLDKIEEKQSKYVDTLNEFYLPFKVSLEHVKDRKKEIKKGLQEETGVKCDVCGRPMVIRWGRNGKFYACTGYPECKNTKPLEEVEQKTTEEICEKCGSPMVVKRGRFGEFLACSNYPECKNTRPISTGVRCPEPDCDGTVVQRQSKKGKIFYSCSNYPKCKFALWDRPINEQCPNCSYPIMVEKISRSEGHYKQCPKCKFKMVEEKVV
jgi:DNA topoisomerase I